MSEIPWMSTLELIDAYGKGDVSPVEVVASLRERIDRVNARINAFVTLLPETADETAKKAEEAYRRGKARPLEGVPVAIKDDTDVAGQTTAWGSAVDRGMCDHDAEVVRRLRRTGAVVIGKTNVPELTLWPWTATRRWGVTRNPWNLDRTPGGSSGGSAAAVAGGLISLGTGGDGGGASRIPAGDTGLLGMKGTYRRLSPGPRAARGCSAAGRRS